MITECSKKLKFHCKVLITIAANICISWMFISRLTETDVCNSTIGFGSIKSCSRRFAPGIGHFRVPKTLTFKMRLGAQPFLGKWVLFAWEWKMISISKAEHLPSFWNRGPGELGNGLFNFLPNEEKVSAASFWVAPCPFKFGYFTGRCIRGNEELCRFWRVSTPPTLFLFDLQNK